MKLKDLSDFHIIEDRDGYKQLFCQRYKSLYTEDLLSKDDKNCDVMKVYEYDKVIWEREKKDFNKVNKIFLSENIYYYDGCLYESEDDLKREFIDNYTVLDDGQEDFITDEQCDSFEISRGMIETLIIDLGGDALVR